MKKVIGLVLGLLMAGNVIAQDCVSKTGNNAIITLPKDIGDAAGLQDGDVIQAHYGALCAGKMVYHMTEGQTGIAMAVWGDNSLTEELDGMPEGKSIVFQVYRPSTKSTYTDVSVNYAVGDDIYAPNSIKIVGGMVVNGRLPKALTKFEAQVRDATATLIWETVSGKNIAGFEIQQKMDSTYRKVEYVDPQGAANQSHLYRHTMPNLAPGEHSFRLKIFEQDGSYSLSDAVTVETQITGNYVLSKAYPNPFSARANFNITLRNSEHVSVSVYDVVGRRVRSVYEGTMAANEKTPIHFDSNGLSSGLYLIRVQGESFSDVREVTLVR